MVQSYTVHVLLSQLGRTCLLAMYSHHVFSCPCRRDSHGHVTHAVVGDACQHGPHDVRACLQFLAALLDCAPALNSLEVSEVDLSTNKYKKRTWALQWLKINHDVFDIRSLINLPTQTKHRLVINASECKTLPMHVGYTV